MARGGPHPDVISAGNEPTAALPVLERIWRGVVWLGFGPNAPMGVDEFGHLIAAPFKARPAWDTDTTNVHQLHVSTWAHRDAA